MYKLNITYRELKDLAWLTDRGFFPEEFYDGMQEVENENNTVGDLITFEIPEHVAWSLLDMRENDPEAYLTCMGGPLLTKILDLESEIV